MQKNFFYKKQKQQNALCARQHNTNEFSCLLHFVLWKRAKCKKKHICALKQTFVMQRANNVVCLLAVCIQSEKLFCKLTVAKFCHVCLLFFCLRCHFFFFLRRKKEKAKMKRVNELVLQNIERVSTITSSI